jgi:phosphatidylinositol-bisphosphatase
VTDLNLGKEKVDDILVLHLENGKDIFISLFAEFKTTVFGLPLEVLARLSDPITSIKSLNVYTS